MKLWLGRLILLFLMVIFIIPQNLYAKKKLYQDRIYEPVILRGDILAPLYNFPINEIFMYAYHDSTQTWTMIPFQIDEMKFAQDPFKPENENAKQDFYFIQDDGLLDFRDELVFMIRDLGDRASSEAWIDNEEAQKFERLEIVVRDPNEVDNAAYGYLFRSSTVTDEVPSPYGFSFDLQNQIAKNHTYSLRLSKQNGLIEDIAINPPFGSGVDIFDTQKLRFIGVFDLGIITISIGKNGFPAANERDNLYVYNENDLDNFHLWYTPKPVVRLIREVRQTIRFGEFFMNETAFYIKTKFYPFSGTIGGGAELDPETLKQEFHMEEDIFVRLELLRQSWDFNSAAAGMKFYNKYNDRIPIDGVSDNVNKNVKKPIKEWTLTTGEQGSMFTFVEFKDTTWQNIELYFHDNQEGGQADETVVEGGDTGDGMSFGDQGILFRNQTDNNVSLRLNFTAFFLPKNADKSAGEKLAYCIENPVVCQSNAISFSTEVTNKNYLTVSDNFRLNQNYPNPFNSSTKISFTIPYSENILLRVIDMNGRTLKTLINGMLVVGNHEITWKGIDEKNNTVVSGVYFYEIRSKNFASVRKLILIR